MLQLLQLGFAEAAIAQRIKGQRGGPYVAWDAVADTVLLLRRRGFTQEQLDKPLAAGSTSSSIFVCQPADVEASMRWLQQEFGLAAQDLCRACTREPALLIYPQATLARKWQRVQAEYQLAEAAKSKLAYALRQAYADFLLYDPATIRDKVAVLRSVLGLSNEQVSAKFGGLAFLLNLDVAKLEPRFQLLQHLTGKPAADLATRILDFPHLLNYQEKTVQRKYDAIVKAVGSVADGKLLLLRRPDILAAAVDRVARNLQTLQRLGCSPRAAVQVLVGNVRLGVLDLEQPAFKARVTFWQAAYGFASAEEAMTKCSEMLHRSLHTVALRVAFWRSKRQGLQLAEFEAFKQAWLAGEGAEACRHERHLRGGMQHQL